MSIPESNGVPDISNFLASRDKLEPIAIIGMSAKFPQDATSPAAFWQLLCEGRSAMTEVPEDRWKIDSFYHPDANRLDTLNARGGHFLEGDVAAFDAPFFSIPRTEAVSLDPQQRGLLESAYKALENAGLPMEHVTGSRTGVYVGCYAHDYDAVFNRDPLNMTRYQASGVGSAMLSNRLSWFYNFTGPSMTIDTACSSSLNALHLACQSLRSRESSMALVAGSNVIINPEAVAIPLSNLSLLSSDSRCYSFDARANGYSRGEGIGVMVLKPLSCAIRDGNLVRAVIRATGSNQDGKTPGITQPSMAAQERLIRDTYASGGLDLGTTRFFEAHGTGTPIGDPVEASAIAAVFQSERSSESPLYIGAVKSNIGHLEGASGMASLVKTVQILENGFIPPNIWFEKPNPAIPVEEWNIRFPLQPTPWPKLGLRRASINSFSYGGSNAHVVMEDARHYLSARSIMGKHCTVERPPDARELSARYATVRDSFVNDSLNSSALSNGSLPNGSKSLWCHQSNSNHSVDSSPSRNLSRPRLFVWSASDEAGLKRQAMVYCDHFSELPSAAKSEPDKYIEDLAYTLATKRSRLPWKSYVTASSLSDLQSDLLGKLSKPVRSTSGAPPQLGFVFTGQGAQWHAMGRELLTYPVFECALRHSDMYLKELGCKWSLIEELQRDKDQSQVHSPEFSQPLCTALQIALVDLLASWSIRPLAVIGHSSGEIAAAYCARGLSRDAAIKVAYFRGVLAARLAINTREHSGSMMSVALSEAALQPHLKKLDAKGSIAVGCVNSPVNSTVTGDEALVDELKKVMDDEGVFTRKLKVGVAYHSTQMNAIAQEYRRLIHDIAPPTDVMEAPAMFSSVTGTYVPTDRLYQSEYWVSNLTSKVQFAPALAQMRREKYRQRVAHFLEIGPHGALRRPIKDTVGHNSHYFSMLHAGTSALQSSLDLIGQLHCHGYTVNLTAVNSPTCSEADLSMLIDLPEYQFNHSQVYWHESRISRNFRFRQHPRHELLGTPSADWNSLEAKWRNIIKRSENPWVSEHKSNETELYPGAGMVVMAMEAARQIARDPAAIQGYRLKDVRFSKALLLPLDSEADVETQFHMRPGKVGNAAEEKNDFRLTMLSNDEWVEVCCGVVTVEYEEALDEVNNSYQSSKEGDSYKDIYVSGIKTCKRNIASKQLYDNLASFGFNFGPTFQNLKDVSYGHKGEATASVALRDWMEKVPKGTEIIQPHVIHPTTLDSVFHLAVVGLTKGGWEPVPTIVPTMILDMWVSNELLTRTTLKHGKAFARSSWNGYREVDSKIVLLHPETEETLLAIDSYRGTVVGSLDAYRWRRLCFGIDWKPDVDMLSTEQLGTLCENAAKLAHGESGVIDVIDRCELTCLYFMQSALLAVETDYTYSSPVLQTYVAWMKHCRSESGFEHLLATPELENLRSDETYREAFFSDLENSSPEGKLYVTVGRQLLSILHGEVDPLEILFSDDMMSQFYSGNLFMISYRKMMAYLELLSHKNPSLSVLEIGAGTGGATQFALQAMGPQDPTHEHGTPKYEQYTYTDISPKFFEDAKQRFRVHAGRMVFKTLDIEKDPVAQGFEMGTYDLVIASCVLHATGCIDTTLANVRKLLKPGGKMVLIEPTNVHSVRTTFVFGLLPGWWLSKEKHRQGGPLLSDETWNYTLGRNGFSGADICLPDQDPAWHTCSVIMSTADKAEVLAPTVSIPHTMIVIAQDCPIQNQIAQDLKRQLLVLGALGCRISTIGEIISATDLSGDFCIFLPEIEKPYLYGVSEEEFVSLKHITTSARGILWITKDNERIRNPELELVMGFSRSIRSEFSDLTFVTLALEPEPESTSVANMLKVYRAILSAPQEQVESEYQSQHGLLCINRLVENHSLNDHIYSKLARQNSEPRPFSEDASRPLLLTIGSPGLLDTLCFVDDDGVTEPLGPLDIEVKVEAVGVNFRDVMTALGQLPSKDLGLEGAGTVTRVGASVDPAQIKPGDRVCFVSPGAYKTYARCTASTIARIPDDMPFVTAASLPIVFCTAYYALFHIAHISHGESILIHSAAGGVGQAAIQLAKSVGAEIFATVGSSEKKELLMQTYDIPADHIFSSRNVSFARGIKRMTHNRGVNIVLNSLSGEKLKVSFECIAPMGRFLEIGKKDMAERADLPMAPFLANVMFASVDLGVLTKHAPDVMRELMETVVKLTKTCPPVVRAPVPLHVRSINEIEVAMRYLQGGKNTGKTVIEMESGGIVPVLRRLESSWTLDSNATYLITGGLGGLGRTIARWMVSRGAKHLLLLSRSGAQTPVAVAFLKELTANGVDARAPLCDISDKEMLKCVLDEQGKTMPPIKGCIQASMVLRDSILEKMTSQDFNAPLAPKVTGSWNLHTHLPPSLTFFILLSSSGGVIGNPGQSNYTSANTYQDSLARHLSARGRRCISLNLGLMTEAGFVAERQQLMTAFKVSGHEGIRNAELFAILDYVCDPTRGVLPPQDSQIVLGAGTPASMKAKGFDELLWMRRPLFRNLMQMDRLVSNTDTDDSIKTEVNTTALLRKVETLDAAIELVEKALVRKLANALCILEEDVEVAKPVHAYGVDSLVAVELRNWFLKELNAEVTVIDIVGAASVQELIRMATESIKPLQGSLRRVQVSME
ncbi:hypothetical protein EPUS_00742 [Endocarpon pusillum Z07020]|uniref:Uncharacterized protein n=1 Tax=Endocarpon pusillum (strain Z07020 / HMAS-L-300199) TaxID=1263415 RepID=U1GAR7_ENDPU|nr:uncharacterized protein EPUS_00742 [Endocarpon pusillum Z07020]ERF74612.1 hypothetical protein EPUS_00742 [Endocarpon pusillum Z07020]